MSPPRIAPPPSNSDTSEDDAPLDERLDVRNATRKANNAGLEQVVPWSFVRRMSRRSKDLATSAARALASPRANTPTVRPVPRPGAAVTCLEDFACLEDQDLEPHRPHRSAAAPEQRPPSALAPAVSRTSTPPTTDDMVLPIPPERPTVVEEALGAAEAAAEIGEDATAMERAMVVIGGAAVATASDVASNAAPATRTGGTVRCRDTHAHIPRTTRQRISVPDSLATATPRTRSV